MTKNFPIGGNKMKFEIHKTRMLDGSFIWDFNLSPNSRKFTSDGLELKPKCIFSCNTEQDAKSFMMELNKLMEKFTLETLEG